MKMNPCRVCGSKDDVCNYSIQNGFAAHCKSIACSNVEMASNSDVVIALWNLKNPGRSTKRDQAFAQSIIDYYDNSRSTLSKTDLFIAIGVDPVRKLRLALAEVQGHVANPA